MKKIIKALLLIAWMILIFFFSSQVAQDSNVTSNFVIEILYQVCNKFMTNITDYAQFVAVISKPVRKLAHFTEFAILGVLIYVNIIEYRKNRILIISTLLSLLYATSDEIHQLFVPGRSCSIIDVIIDTCGALFGITIVHLIISKWKRKL